MNTGIKTLGIAVLAAAGMYLLDPESGRRRRARLGDRFASNVTSTRQGIGVARRDLKNRLRGVAAQSRSHLQRREVSDDVLAERVRAALGRAVSHPGAIEVSSAHGRVALEGYVLRHEHDRLLRAVRGIKGVSDIEDRLSVHKTPERISALQGGGSRFARGVAQAEQNWSPATRLLTAVAGGSLILWGMRGRGLLGLTSGVAGGALALRSKTNMPLERLAGGTGRRAIDIRKTLHVDAPIEQVFATLSRYEDFPAFMRNVRKVSLHDDGRSHWVVAGPAGVSVEWDAETTACVPNEVLAWRTVRNATVEHAGIIHFRREGRGTRLDIQMTYNPPAGALGHGVAKLFGADAKTELDEDLMRLKTFLETGVPARDAAGRHDDSALEQAVTQASQQQGAEQSSGAQPSL